MLETRVEIVNRLGLHARAAAQLVRLAGKFKSRIKLMRDETGVMADAKSILSVLTLAAAKGVSLRVEADGVDETDAIDAITALFSSGFGEE